MKSIEQNKRLKYLKIGGLLIVTNILLFSFFTQGLGGLKENFIVSLYTVAICSFIKSIYQISFCMLPSLVGHHHDF